MKVFLLKIVLLSWLCSGNTSFFETHFIGMNENEIKELIAEKHRSLKLNTVTINSSYNYLKFEDGIREITVLFFLDEEDNCKAVRLMSDYSNINEITQELDKNYLKVDNANWKYKKNEKEYFVKLDEGDWFFTVFIQEKKEK